MCDPYGIWREADIIDKRVVPDSAPLLLIHYRFWSNRYNEWLRGDSPRAAPAGTWVFAGLAQGLPRVGHWVDFLPAHVGSPVWQSGVVLEVAPDEAGRTVRVRVQAPPPPLGDGSHAEMPADPARLQPHEWKTRAVVPPAAVRPAFGGARERRAALTAAAKGAGVDPRVHAYLSRLEALGLELVPMGGDGNCLFRSVADQVYGDQERHVVVRAAAARYMRTEAAYFRPFVVDSEDGAGWEAYLIAIAQHGTWGDDPEVQALSEIYGRPVEIWAYDADEGARRIRVFNASAGFGGGGGAPPPIRLSFFGGGHYDSVRPRGVAWAAGAAGAALLEGGAAGQHEEGVLAAAEARRAAAAPGAFQEALRLSREQFDRVEHDNLEAALARSLAGVAPPAAAPAPSLEQRNVDAAMARSREEAVASDAKSLEEEQVRAAIRASVDISEENQQIEAAMRDSLAGGGGAEAPAPSPTDVTALLEASRREEEERQMAAALKASMPAAQPLTEEQQLDCIMRGLTAEQYLQELQAGRTGAAGGGAPSFELDPAALAALSTFWESARKKK